VTALLLPLLLAPTLLVRVEGDATEVIAFRDGQERARAAVRDGAARLEVEPGTYDLVARGPAAASEPARGVRAVDGPEAGVDARLVARPAFPVEVATAAGATIWCDGLPGRDPVVPLAPGLHRIAVDHPGHVSSAERLLRVTGPARIDVPLDPGLAVAGRVVDGKGASVAGARVEVFVDGIPAGRTAFTDADGRFGAGGFAGDVCSLRISAPGFATRLERLLFAPGSERARCDAVLEPGSSVSVEATGPGGARVAFAEGVLLPEWYEHALEEPRLRVNFTPAEAAGPGEVRFDGLTPGRRYRIVLQAPGHRPAATAPFVAPPAGESAALPRVALEVGAALTGRLADAGRVVVCQGPEGTRTSRTDRTGAWSFDGLDPGEHILWVRDEDETGHPVTLLAGERRALDLACVPGGEDRCLAGLVVDADGAPLPGVEVEAFGRRAYTNDEGAFHLAGLPRGPARTTVSFTPGPACRALAQDPHLPHVERKVLVGGDMRVRLERAGRLRVRLDTGGRALTRARLLLTSGARELQLEHPLPRHVTEVVIDDLPVGPCSVEVKAPGFTGTGGAVVQVAPAPAEATPVAVAGGRAARGTVHLRKVLRGASLLELALDRGWVGLLTGEPRQALAVTPVEPDGSFFLEGLPAGPVLLFAAAPGLPVATLAVDLTAADADGLRLVLEPAAEASVRVMDADGRPLNEARARVVDARGIDIRDLAARGRFLGVVAGEEDLDEVELSCTLRRDGAGRIAAPFLAPGSYRFQVSAPGCAAREVGVRALAAERRAEIQRDFGEAFPGGPPDLATPVRLEREGRD